MSDMHSSPDRVVWFDLPVADLERAGRFYAAVLEHGPDGNGGCLIPNAKEVSAAGILVYMNVEGRIRDAVAQTQKHGGGVLEGVEKNSPHRLCAHRADTGGKPHAPPSPR